MFLHRSKLADCVHCPAQEQLITIQSYNHKDNEYSLHRNEVLIWYRQTIRCSAKKTSTQIWQPMKTTVTNGWLSAKPLKNQPALKSWTDLNEEMFSILYEIIEEQRLPSGWKCQYVLMANYFVSYGHICTLFWLAQPKVKISTTFNCYCCVRYIQTVLWSLNWIIMPIGLREINW